mmetsp:Transcript_22299/g.59277  ORF Transcript_22299/g.59277 Transcript_22299/m.59277 type:complete len:247 (-) Transcript_22299:1702-2442(-)
MIRGFWLDFSNPTRNGEPRATADASTSPMPKASSMKTSPLLPLTGFCVNMMKDTSAVSIFWTSTAMYASLWGTLACERLRLARLVQRLSHTFSTALEISAELEAGTLAIESYRPAPLMFSRSSQLALDRTISSPWPENFLLISSAIAPSRGNLATSARISSALASCSLPFSESKPSIALVYAAVSALANKPKGIAAPVGVLKSPPLLAAILSSSPAAAALAPEFSLVVSTRSKSLHAEISALGSVT